MAVVVTLQTLAAAALSIAVVFVLQVITFVMSFNLYESRGVEE